MELTIRQSLYRGVEAHKDGLTEEAERFYRAILAAQPNHPDANHNLGVLFRENGRLSEAIPLFKLALDSNPQIEQFWLSYVGALTKNGEADAASRALAKAAANFSIEESSKPRFAEAYFNLGVLLKQQGEVGEAINCYIHATLLAPRFAEAHNNLGLLQRSSGRPYQAIDCFRRAIALKPNYDNAYFNFGVVLSELNRCDEAEAAYKQAITLNPSFADAHNNLGALYQTAGKLEKAVASYRAAISCGSSFPGAHSNLGMTLERLGELDSAIAEYFTAVTIDPEFKVAAANLGLALRRFRFTQLNRDLYPALITLLESENRVRPRDIASSVLSLLRHEPLIQRLLTQRAEGGAISDILGLIGNLSELELLHSLMRVTPLPDAELEGLFTKMRSTLLSDLPSLYLSDALTKFLSTLAMHCFTNEYVYSESSSEVLLLQSLEQKILAAVRQGNEPELKEVLVFACYRTLHHCDWSADISCLDEVPALKKRLIDEPLRERVIKEDIPRLGNISDTVSIRVRSQYEEHPYPRWERIGIPEEKLSLRGFCADYKLRLQSDTLTEVASPKILVAGCGTGQHSIGTATRFSNCTVLAIDLSSSSLAYAQRKTEELGIKNIDYMQADILSLAMLRERFDYVECVGVLHHMDQPMAGWKILCNLLNPGGIMKIGLYSEAARSSIAEVRSHLRPSDGRATDAEIRLFRDSVLASNSEVNKQIRAFSDFYSLSEVRDLVFHVQEHRFSLPQVSAALRSLGLNFCGFGDRDLEDGFRSFFGDEADPYDLGLWHRFEEAKPRIFSAMYQFWCQKVS